MSDHTIPGDLNLFLAVRDHASSQAQLRLDEAEQLEQRAATLRHEAAGLRSLHAVAVEYFPAQSPTTAIEVLA